jgi:hypothetical protein
MAVDENECRNCSNRAQKQANEELCVEEKASKMAVNIYE